MLAWLGVLACASGGEEGVDLAPTEPLALRSSLFADGAALPDTTVYAGGDCTGGNQSPPLEWSGGRDGARSYALIAHDPDAPRDGGWTHWVLFDLPAATRALPADAGNVSRAGMPDGAAHGTTDFGERAYGGPCPPPGAPHRYEFRLYALDVKTLGLGGVATRADVERAMSGHILDQTVLTGTYGRP